MRRKKRHHAVLLWAAAALVAGSAAADEIIVADATDMGAPDNGAVYRITENGDMDTVHYGPPLQSPSGILFDGRTEGGDLFFVTDLGVFRDMDDGALYKVGGGASPRTIWAGPPLSSPFGMVRIKDVLYVADFGDPTPGELDGAVFAFDLDPDGDGAEGPYPLPAEALSTVYAGPPLGGPNEMVWFEGNRLLLADDAGSLYVLDPRREFPAPEPFGPVFVDPVGLARPTSRSGFLVADPNDASIWWVDRHGDGAELVHDGGLPDDQYLGAAIAPEGWAVVSKAGPTLFGAAEDGAVLRMDRQGMHEIWAGMPLQNPMGIQVLGDWKHPRKK